MAKEKADSDEQGWFARWRERRGRNKLRATEMGHRVYDDALKIGADRESLGVLAAAERHYVGSKGPAGQRSFGASSIDVDARVTPWIPPGNPESGRTGAARLGAAGYSATASLCLDKQQSLATRPARRSNSQPSLSRDTAAAWGTRPSADDEERCHPREAATPRSRPV